MTTKENGQDLTVTPPGFFFQGPEAAGEEAEQGTQISITASMEEGIFTSQGIWILPVAGTLKIYFQLAHTSSSASQSTG